MHKFIKAVPFFRFWAYFVIWTDLNILFAFSAAIIKIPVTPPIIVTASLTVFASSATSFTVRRGKLTTTQLTIITSDTSAEITFMEAHLSVATEGYRILKLVVTLSPRLGELRRSKTTFILWFLKIEKNWQVKYWY